MQQFTVPQFIDVEDKVVGPLSVRQFIILMVTFGLVALFYKLFDFSLFVVSGIIMILVSSAFAFVNISGMPLHYFLLNLAQTLSRPSLRVWNKALELEIIDIVSESTKKETVTNQRLYTSSHLNRLALIVDTKGYYSGEDESAKIYKESSNLDDMLIG